MRSIGIIGGGFTGTMTAVHLIQKSTKPIEIVIITESETLNKGVAFNPYSDKHLLNVVTGKMGAFPENPEHFLNWVMQQPEYASKDRTLIANSFLPRRLYGEYLSEVWKEAMQLAAEKKILVSVIEAFVVDVDVDDETVSFQLDDGSLFKVNQCVIATGNHEPRNPSIKNQSFYQSSNYYRNPWKIDAVANVDATLPVLIVGNGLTMVDTVFGLLEHGYKGDIYSISPNGFNILPHRHNGLRYNKINEEVMGKLSLYELVCLVNRHIKAVREYGVSAEPIIDSLRSHTQQFWRNFTIKEKDVFMNRLRHLWGVARHRIPLHSHDKLQQLRIDGRLHIAPGKIQDFVQLNHGVAVEYFDKKEKKIRHIVVSRVINCTGPETDLLRIEKSFLKQCVVKGILAQDRLKLGINADPDTFEIINGRGDRFHHLFTLGSNLKGQLWETTAVNELRAQAEALANSLLTIPALNKVLRGAL